MDKFVLVYLDDILIYSRTKQEHLTHLDKVLRVLMDHQLVANKEKCAFFTDRVDYLGHTITPEGISVDAQKVAVIKNWEPPQDVQQVQSFMGMANYYRRFIDGFADMAAPITDLLKGKPEKINWTPHCQSAFERIKNALSTAPVLISADPHRPYVVHTDASLVAIGAVLMQDLGNGLQPIAYESKKLSEAEKKYPIHELELYAVVHALRTWRYYLLGSNFVVKTDHESLKYFDSTKHLSRRLHRWLEDLLEFSPTLQYMRGEDQVVADALSRLATPQEAVNSISLEEKNWPELLPAFLRGEGLPEDTVPAIKHRLEAEKDRFEVKEQGDIFRKVDDELVPYVKEVDREPWLEHYHKSYGHPGVIRLQNLLKYRLWWPEWKTDAKLYVKYCPECQTMKRNPTLGTDEPHAIEPVLEPFQRWSVDFLGPYTATKNGNRWVLVALDHATGWPIAKAMKTATEQDVADFLYREIIVNYGCPYEILSDRGSNFLAKTLQEYLAIQSIHHKKTSAYHPQGNGRTERMNQTLKTMIIKQAKNAKANWDEYLDQAVLSARVETSTVTGNSPFFLMYGVPPKIPGDRIPPLVVNEELHHVVGEQQRKNNLTKLWKLRHQCRKKVRWRNLALRAKYHNGNKRKNRKYQENDAVLLRNKRAASWQKRWFGPLRIHRVLQWDTYLLMTIKGKILATPVHGSMLKPAYVKDSTLYEWNMPKNPRLLLEGESVMTSKALTVTEPRSGQNKATVSTQPHTIVTDNDSDEWTDVD